MIAADLPTAISRLGDLFENASVIVPFTGAGISTECGIPDFRSPGGLWTKNQPIPFDAFVASQDMRDEMEARQKQVRIVLEGFKASNDVAREKLVALLNADQRNKLKDYEEEAQKKFDEEIRRRSRGGDRGNSGGSRRPREV